MHPDPTVCRVGRDFYLACSSFEYFPGVPLYTSRDLVHWTPVGHALTRRSQLDLRGVPSSGGVYAPTLRHHDGTFFLVTTLVGRGNFVVTAPSPRGPWSDPIWLDEDGIDPSLAFLDGRVFYTRNGPGADLDHPFVYQGELTLAGGPPIAVEPRVIWRGTGGVWPEGPHLYRRGELVLPRCGRGWHELRALGRGRPRHRSVRALRALPARAAAHAPRPAPAADPGHGARRPRRPRGRHDLGRAAGDPTARRPAPPPRSRDVPRTRPLGRRRMAADVARQGSARGTGSRAGPGARRARATPLPARPPSHGLALRPEPRSRLLHPPGTTGIPAPLGNRGDDPRRRLACARLPAPAAFRGDRTGPSPVRAGESGRAGRVVPQGERGLQRGPRRGARPGRPGASPRRHAARRDVDARAARARGRTGDHRAPRHGGRVPVLGRHRPPRRSSAASPRGRSPQRQSSPPPGGTTSPAR